MKRGEVMLRPLRWSDALFCWRLARDTTVRRWSVDERQPNPWRHWQWMRRQIRTGSALLITIENRERVGVQTLTPYRYGLAVGISILSRWRSCGIGTEVLRLLVAAARLKRERVYALIKPQNVSSIKAFEKAGFIRTSVTDNGLLAYEATPYVMVVPGIEVRRAHR